MSSSSGLWKPTREMSELLDHHDVPSGSKWKPRKAWGEGGTWECRILPTVSGAAVPVGAGVSPLPPGLLCLGGFSPRPLGLLCKAGFRSQPRRTPCVNYTLPCNLTRGLSESLKFFLIFLIIFSKTSFAQPSKCKMSEAIIQNLKNADLPL